MELIQTFSIFPLLAFVGIAAVILARRLKLNPFVLALLFGVALGLLIPELNQPEVNTSGLIRMALGAMAFAFGIRVGLNKLDTYTQAGVATLVVLFLTLAISFILLPIAGVSQFAVMMLGLVIGIGSLSYSWEILSHHDQLQHGAGSMAKATLGVAHIAMIPIFGILSAMALDPQADMFSTLLTTGLFIAILLAYRTFLMPSVVSILSPENDEQVNLIVMVATVCLFALLANLLSIDLVVAAFMIGVTINNIEVMKQIKLWPSITTTTAAVIAVALGIMVDLGDLNVVLAALLLLVLLPIKTLLTAIIQIWFGADLKEALAVSMATFGISEFILILLLQANQGGATWFSEPGTLNTIIIVVIISQVISPFLYLNIEWFYDTLESRLRSSAPNIHRGLFINSRNSQVTRVKRTKRPR